MALAALITLSACMKPGDETPWERWDEHAPVPAETCPLHDTAGVETGVNPRVRFEFPGEGSPDLDPDSLSDRSVTLTSSGEFPVPGEVLLDRSSGVVVFRPRRELKPFVRYEIVVTSEVRDLLGNHVERGLTAEFVTGDLSDDDPCAGWTGTRQ